MKIGIRVLCCCFYSLSLGAPNNYWVRFNIIKKLTTYTRIICVARISLSFASRSNSLTICSLIYIHNSRAPLVLGSRFCCVYGNN